MYWLIQINNRIKDDFGDLYSVFCIFVRYKTGHMHIIKTDISGIWGNTTIHWEKINPEVNIIVGNNGSGKSTLLSILRDALTLNATSLKKQDVVITLKTTEGVIHFDEKKFTLKPSDEVLKNVYYINTFDIPSSRKTARSMLTEQLDAILHQRDKSIYSFSDYRLEMLSADEFLIRKAQMRIRKLYDIINDLFESTGKTINPGATTEINFLKNGKELPIDALSSGEKQLLILLFTVFLMDNKKSIMLMDEPELSLHICWQNRLIDILRQLNPNCQLILSTHAPSIFGRGWGDKVVYMEDIEKNYVS